MACIGPPVRPSLLMLLMEVFTRLSPSECRRAPRVPGAGLEGKRHLHLCADGYLERIGIIVR